MRSTFCFVQDFELLSKQLHQTNKKKIRIHKQKNHHRHYAHKSKNDCTKQGNKKSIWVLPFFSSFERYLGLFTLYLLQKMLVWYIVAVGGKKYPKQAARTKTGTIIQRCRGIMEHIWTSMPHDLVTRLHILELYLENTSTNSD